MKTKGKLSEISETFLSEMMLIYTKINLNTTEMTLLLHLAQKH